MVICLCATRNMYPQLQASIMMLLDTQPCIKKIYAFVEDDFASIDNKVYFINVSNYEPLINNKVNIAPGWWTYMTMARCYFADLLPNENKIIYLDLDVMIEQDISEFWNINLQNDEVAGVVDTKFYKLADVSYIKDITTYINGGVLLMNLDLIRKNKTNIKMKELLHTKKLNFLDQDCINLCCKVLNIDCKYNNSYATQYSDNPLIHHVVKQKPWQGSSEWYNKWQNIYQKAKEQISFIKI